MSVKVPSVKFPSQVTEVAKRLTNAYNNLKLLQPTYGIAPDEAFVFDQKSFDEFARKVCEEHYGRVYSRKGIAKTIRDKVKGDFLNDVIKALKKSKSVRLGLLVVELNKLIK